MQGNLAGWKSKKRAPTEFFKCPGCGHAQESLFIDEEQCSQCFACNKKFPKDQFGTAKVRRTVVECADCGTEVWLTPSNANMFGIGYMCSNSNCRKCVAVDFGAGFLNPVTVLEQSWSSTGATRFIPVATGLAFFVCRTKRDYLIVQILQALAKEEDKRFMSVTADSGFSVGLLFDTSKKKLVGYLTWNIADGHAVLHQIFIVADERRRGLATQLVIFWVKEYADKVSDRFGIEGPNEKARNLHAKLGHIRIEGDTAYPLKAFFAPTF